MEKKPSITSATLWFIIGSFLIMGATIRPARINTPAQDKLRECLVSQVHKNFLLTRENENNKLEVARLRQSLDEWRFFDWHLKFYRKWCGGEFPTKYVADPETVRQVRASSIKWKHLAGDQANAICPDLPNFMMAVIENESHFDPFAIYKDNRLPGWDFGITQINEGCSVLALQLPKELRWRNWKTDIEANIAMRYIWIKNRQEKLKLPWLCMDARPSRGWDYLAHIRRLK